MSLTDDLKRFKESSLSAEEMARYLSIKMKLNPDAFSDEASSVKPSKGRRGRRKQAPEKPSEEQSTPTPEKPTPRQKGSSLKVAVSQSQPQPEKVQGAE